MTRAKGTGSSRELENGLWEISLPWQGKRKYKRVRGSQADAERALIALRAVLEPKQHAVDAGAINWTFDLPEPKVTLVRAGSLSSWLNSWLANHRGRASTVARYRAAVERYIKPTLGDILLSELKPAHVDQFYSEISRKGLAPLTVKHIASTLASALNKAVAYDEIPKNPTKAVTKPAAPKVEINIPTRQDVEDVLRLCLERTPDLYPLLWTIIYTGARRGEAMGARWENVNLLTGRMRIKEALVIQGGKPALQGTKTDEARTIALDPATVSMLAAHREAQDKLIEAGQMVNRGIVFADSKGDFIHPRRLLRAVESYSSQVGSRFHVHDLRHFHASVLLQNGEPLATVSKRLGHRDQATTLRFYSHLLPGDAEGAAVRFANLMGTAKEKVDVGF